MKTCPNCNTNVTDETKFCPNCGAQLPNEESVQYEKHLNHPPKRKSNTLLIVGACAVAAVIFYALLAYFFIWKNDKNKEVAETSISSANTDSSGEALGIISTPCILNTVLKSSNTHGLPRKKVENDKMPSDVV